MPYKSERHAENQRKSAKGYYYRYKAAILAKRKANYNAKKKKNKATSNEVPKNDSRLAIEYEATRYPESPIVKDPRLEYEPDLRVSYPGNEEANLLWSNIKPIAIKALNHDQVKDGKLIETHRLGKR